ncbi:MAG: DUF3325 domain-containing protein [Hyphomonadaceae bacterium]|nr:DUF3325 domain-containing protein [Hyphomonadaceae bacterium]
MRDLALFLVGFAATYAGFVLLALAMSRHWRGVLGREGAPATPRSGAALALRAMAVALLGGCLWLVVHADGPSFGATLWVVLLTLGALATVATLTWRPAWVRPLARMLHGARTDVPQARELDEHGA